MSSVQGLPMLWVKAWLELESAKGWEKWWVTMLSGQGSLMLWVQVWLELESAKESVMM